MNRIRPIARTDLDALLSMARTAGAGFTSLPPDRDFLAQRIERSLQSFAAPAERPGAERYLFVLEDAVSGEVGGCCAIEAACGLDEPFYNYRVGLSVHASRTLDVYQQVPTLYLSNDLTGSSVLCSLYLRPEFRANGAGHLLSRSRLLFMAQFPQRFSTKAIAEMRGVSDERGRSPFWEGLGRHFFHIEYDAAEHAVGRGNKACIAELMPRHPIYTVLLPPEAQSAMGRVHPQTAPALRLLEQEGFRYQGHVDIFDGGPTVEVPLADIRSVCRSGMRPAVPGSRDPRVPMLIATTRVQDFRCVLTSAHDDGERLHLTSDDLETLGATAGETLRAVALETAP